MTICLYGVEDLFRKLPIHWMWWPAIGGLAVGIGGLFDPAALGVGYENIRALLQGGVDLHAATELLLVKAGIWVVALSSGWRSGWLSSSSWAHGAGPSSVRPGRCPQTRGWGASLVCPGQEGLGPRRSMTLTLTLNFIG